MGIRTKILSGFLVLTVLLVLAGVWSIYELSTVGTSVQRLLDDNYKSINAAKSMIGALEREESGVLLLLLGKWKEGQKTIKAADLTFEQSLQIAQNNVTIPGEKICVDDIEKAYEVFKELWAKPIVGTRREGNLNWYFQELHRSFLNVKSAAERLMALNDQVMYQTAKDLKDRAHRAVMPGLVAIMSALVFTLVFNYFVDYYLVGPIIKITKGIQKFMETNEPFQVHIETKDELANLASAIKILVATSHKHEAT